MEQVNWGIIGCGDVTEIKSGPAFNKVHQSQLVAVMRRDAEKAADYAQRHQVPKWYNKATELINDPEVNAIYVATPPNSHAHYTIEALNAGKPVYVEKPMAISPQECEAMIKASKKNKVPLFVAYYRRALPGFVKVKELIDSGAIGKPFMVNLKLLKSFELTAENETPWRVNPDIAGAGLFFDLASHQLDYLDYLFGPITQVSGIAKNRAGKYQAEDTVSANMVFENGVVGSGAWCFAVAPQNETDVMEIIGEKGSIGFSCFDFVPVMLNNENGMQQFFYEKPAHVQQYLIEKVVGELVGTDKSPSNGENGMRTNQIMQTILNNYYNN